jgi:hypothetical protein
MPTGLPRHLQGLEHYENTGKKKKSTKPTCLTISALLIHLIVHVTHFLYISSPSNSFSTAPLNYKIFL